MLEINELHVTLYIIVAVAIIFLGTKFSMPGAERVFAFATLFSLFFSMGIIVGHGVIPFPGLWILGSYWYKESCSKMYGDTSYLMYFTLIPMFVQWLIILAISFATYYVFSQMEFAQAISNEANDNAKKHKRIITIAWLVFGICVFLIPVVSIGYVYFIGEKVQFYQLFSVRIIIALLQMIAGFSLLKNIFWAHWLCLPLSVLSLLSFPIGTALAAYYLWYYLSIERKIFKIN